MLDKSTITIKKTHLNLLISCSHVFFYFQNLPVVIRAFYQFMERGPIKQILLGPTFSQKNEKIIPFATELAVPQVKSNGFLGFVVSEFNIYYTLINGSLYVDKQQASEEKSVNWYIAYTTCVRNKIEHFE